MRWSDMDAYQHINNVAFLGYFEMARVNLFFEHPTHDEKTGMRRGLVVASHEIAYKRPVVYYAEPLEVQSGCPTSARRLHLPLRALRPRAPRRHRQHVLVPFDFALDRPRRHHARGEGVPRPLRRRAPPPERHLATPGTRRPPDAEASGGRVRRRSGAAGELPGRAEHRGGDGGLHDAAEDERVEAARPAPGSAVRPALSASHGTPTAKMTAWPAMNSGTAFSGLRSAPWRAARPIRYAAGMKPTT